MTTDRIRGFLLPFEDIVPTPINALIFVESESGNRVHVCASCEQVYTLLATCPGTEDDLRADLREKLHESRLPAVSAFDPIVIGGWAGGCLVDKLDGDQKITEEALDMFTQEVASTLFLIAPDEEDDGDQAILMTMDEDVNFKVWILSSRADVFACLAQAKELAEPEDYENTVAQFDQVRTIAETDPSRPPVLIEGYAAAIITTIVFCLDEQQRNAS